MRSRHISKGIKERTLANLLQNLCEDRVPPLDQRLAEIRAWRGESDAAFTWLDKALTARDPVLSGIKLDAYLQTLHADPRWKAVLKKIGLPTDL